MSAETRATPGGDPAQAFVARLRAAYAGDRAAKARLRRACGRALEEAPGEALRAFYGLWPPTGRDEGRYFLVATLFPLAQDAEGAGNLGATLRRARTEANAKGLDRRVAALLDADLEQLAFRLRQAVHFAQSRRAAVDYAQLLRDLLLWEVPGRWAQRGWAQAYYGRPPAPQEESRGAGPAAPAAHGAAGEGSGHDRKGELERC